MKTLTQTPYMGGMPFATPVGTGQPLTAYLTEEGAREICNLLSMTTRNPNRCISKGQFKDAAEKLMAQNLILGKEIERLRARLAPLVALVSKSAEINAGLQASHEIGSPTWHAHETIDDRLHDALTALGD